MYFAISAVICGADTWNSIEDFGKSKESFFAAKLSNFYHQWLYDPNNI